MKQEYEYPIIEITWLDECDILTASGGDGEDSLIGDDQGIGGGGYDPGGWT